MNLGWRLAGTPYTLLANDDVRLLDARWYEAAKACLRKDVLAVNPFPALRTWNGGGDPEWYWQKNDKFEWTKDKTIESYTPEDYDHLKQLLTSSDGPGATTFFTLIKTELRDLVGMFDEAFVNNGSDYSLNRRIFLTCKHCQRRLYEHELIDGEYYCMINSENEGMLHLQKSPGRGGV